MRGGDAVVELGLVFGLVVGVELGLASGLAGGVEWRVERIVGMAARWSCRVQCWAMDCWWRQVRVRQLSQGMGWSGSVVG